MGNHAQDLPEHESYDALVLVVFCLTNYDIKKRPLRANDGAYYREHVVQFVNEGRERMEKRAE